MTSDPDLTSERAAVRPSRRRISLLATICYVVVGLATAALAGRAATAHGTTAWRLVAWVLSLAIFVVHVAISRRDRRTSLTMSAARVALAVAAAAFALAALGPLRTHWSDPHRARVALLSLVVWPLLTGLPAFVVALLGAHVIDRRAAARAGEPV